MLQELLSQVSRAAVPFEGYLYATLDFTAPSQTEIGTQSDFRSLPEGWEVSPDEPRIVGHVIAKHHWGCFVLLVSNGNSFYTAQQTPGAPFDYGKGLMVQGNTYKPSGKNKRILIRIFAAPIIRHHSQTAYCHELTSSLWTDTSFCDCEVVCGCDRIPCHRLVLSKASPVLDNMLRTPMTEASHRQIIVRDADPKSVRLMLEFAYTGRLESTACSLELLQLADCYLMRALVVCCAEQLLDKLSAANVGRVVCHLRHWCEDPEGQSLCRRLMEKVRSNDDVLKAALFLIQP